MVIYAASSRGYVCIERLLETKKEQRHQNLKSNRFFEKKFVVAKVTEYENLENLLYRKFCNFVIFVYICNFVKCNIFQSRYQRLVNNAIIVCDY